MRGQTALNRIRVAGYKPMAVFVAVLGGKAPTSDCMDAENSIFLESFPELDVEEEDVIGTLDFRPLTGLQVHVNGVGKRVVDVCKRIVEFRPSRIIACDGEHIWDKRP